MLDKSDKIVVVSGREILRVTCNAERSNPPPKFRWEVQPFPCGSQNYSSCKPNPRLWKHVIPGKEKEFVVDPANVASMDSSLNVLRKSKVRRFFMRCTAETKYGSDSHVILGVRDDRGKS